MYSCRYSVKYNVCISQVANVYIECLHAFDLHVLPCKGMYKLNKMNMLIVDLDLFIVCMSFPVKYRILY